MQQALAGLSGTPFTVEATAARIEAEELRAAYIEAATAASSILNPVKAVGAATRDIKPAAESATEAYEKMLAKMIEASPALSALGFDAENLQSTMQMVESSMEDAFMSMVDGTKKAKDAFRDMAGSIIEELFRVLVVQRLVGGITSALGFPAAPAGAPVVGAASGRSLRSGQPAVVGEHGRELFVPQTAGRVLSVSQAQSAVGGITSALGFPAAPAGAPVVGAASGRSLRSGQPAVVGEHGRELFVPQSAGRVLSVSQAQSAVGGGGSIIVNQTINVSTGVQQTVRTEIKQLMPQIAESAKAAVVDAKRRGGSYGRAFS